MRKIFTLIAAMAAVAASAQSYTMKITKADGTVVAIAAEDVALVEFVEDYEVEEEEATGCAAQVVGTYAGTITMAMAYGTYTYDEQTVTLSEASASTVTFAYSGSLGEVSCVVAVSQDEDGNYVLAETESTMAMDNHSGGTSDYACVVSGTISSDLSDYALVIYCPSVMGGTTFTLAPTNVAAAVYGTYAGTITMAMAYGTYTYDEQSVTLSAASLGTVTFAYSGSLGEVNCEVAVSQDEDGNYVLAETETTMAMDNHAGGTSDYACVVSGTISADLSDYALVIYCPSVMGGTTFTLAPTVEAEEEEEAVTPAAAVAGDYAGTTTMKMVFGTYSYTDQALTLTATADDAVTITYTGTMGSYDLNTVIEGVTVTEAEDGSYTLAGSGNMTMKSSTATDYKDYACTVSGTIAADRSTYSIAFGDISIMGSTTFTFANAE